LRVIAGEFRSRKLKTLPGRGTRPSSDRLRETLFNVLGNEVRGKVFVDAYAGSGAVGIEALSRGAARAIFVEKDRRAVALIRENLGSLGLEGRAEVVAGEAAKVLSRVRGDLVFLDPPYGELGEYEKALERLGELRPELVVAEHSGRMELADSYGALRRVRVLRQGDSRLSFYR
jgi:16S rRNA (guanine(966)-N(2))-methyltransferase RsmD